MNEESVNIPLEFNLTAYPNPFNPITTLRIEIAAVKDYSENHIQKVSLNVFDILGKEIKTLINEEKYPGIYEVQFNGEDLSSGVYFCVLQTSTPDGANNFTLAKKLMLLK